LFELAPGVFLCGGKVMGLSDWFARQITCPGCGDSRARQVPFGRIRCPNRACAYFDASLAGRLQEKEQTESAPVYRNPPPAERIRRPKPAKSFHPEGRILQVRYKNYRGEEKTFSGDARSLRRRHNHISLCVFPSRVRIALSRKRILNLNEVDFLLSKTPTPREQAIFAYHKKRGTTSQLFERLRTKYPDW
jgi:hypothetical protein